MPDPYGYRRPKRPDEHFDWVSFLVWSGILAWMLGLCILVFYLIDHFWWGTL